MSAGITVQVAAREALEAYATYPWAGIPGVDYPADAGPAVLASLVARHIRPEESDPASRALATWLRCIQAGPSLRSSTLAGGEDFPTVTHTGAFSWGLAGCFLGAQFASKTWPRLSGLAASFRSILLERAAMRPWQLRGVSWPDYDVVTGPAGIVLALATDPACFPAWVLPTAAHLATLCDTDDLQRLRVGAYQGEQLRGWNYGRINTGVAHGVAGVVAALRATAEIVGLHDEIAILLQRATRWLVAQSFTDSRGVVTWLSRDLNGDSPPLRAVRRQGWCYGTPGVAWTLWEAGRVLGDFDLQAFALHSARSFLSAYEDTFYLDSFGICHGAAGLLLIADAFARYTKLAGATELRDHLQRHLLEHLEPVVQSIVRDPALLSGSSGALAAMLTLCQGDRAWLPVFGLR